MKKIKQTIALRAAGFFLATGSFAQTAELQVIHNAADPAAATVDVWVNGSLAIDDFTFRSATPFISLPAGVMLNIGIAPGSSTMVSDTIKNFEVTFADGMKYLAVANGVLGSGFAANPDLVPIDFTLFLADSMRTSAVNPTDVDFIVVHGSSDAPSVDVYARNVANLVDDAMYSDITGYISVPAASYILDVTPSAGMPIVASFVADLSTLGGGSAVVFASGFLDSTANNNGPAFGLYAALANGTVVAFPATSQARLQVIHNAADPAASLVDVWVNGTLALNDFAFRTATPYIDLPAGVPLNIGVAVSTSTMVSDTLKNFEVTLQNGNTYIAVANGVLNPASFAANPDGRSTAFTLFVQDMMREMAMNSSETDLRVVHGSSDAPTVDVLTGAAILVDDAVYGDITPYLSVPPAVYPLDITPGNNNSVIVASFNADLSGLTGGSAVVLASGFLDPSSNQNGPAFALIAVLADGTVITLSNTTGIEEKDNLGFNLYPNPADEFLNIGFSENLQRESMLTMTDLTGRTVVREMLQEGIIKHSISTSALPDGIYLLNVNVNDATYSRKILIQ